VLVDFDDFCEDAHRLDLLQALHDANPAFRCTLFAIPGRGSASFWNDVPDWCELAVHGWMHPHSREAEHWNYLDAVKVLARKPPRFTNGFKAPGWQISHDTYRALEDFGWWIADHYDNDWRRPRGIRAHVISRESAAGVDPDHWHGHIGNVCGNGIEETFDVLLPRVVEAESFQFISEVVEPW
jgi:hypothetical protein